MAEVTEEEGSACTSFIDQLWPLILDFNKCDINTTDFIPYFVPERKFDHWWAHEFLASKNFDNYQPAINLDCRKTKAEETKGEELKAKEIEQLPYRDPYIIPLDKQLENLQRDVEVRQKLAKDFANRTYPWYIQRPSSEYNFTITNEMKQLFKNTFEYEILQKIQHFNCSLMLIDVGSDIPLRNLECWQKFSPYVAIVCIVHDKLLCRELKNFNCIFHTVHMDEQEGGGEEKGNWQESLNRAIEVGLHLAKELYFYDDTSKPFVFIFSNNRGICVFDQFKILRKSYSVW